jgi:hypothetical protein
MCKGGAVSCACIVKFAFCQGRLIGDTEWNVNYASYMQFEKKVAGNKFYVMYEGQEDVSLFLHMYWTFSMVLLK